RAGFDDRDPMTEFGERDGHTTGTAPRVDDRQGPPITELGHQSLRRLPHPPGRGRIGGPGGPLPPDGPGVGLVSHLGSPHLPRCPASIPGHGPVQSVSVGLFSNKRDKSPLMKLGDSSVDSSLATPTASAIATPSGMSSAHSSSYTPMRRMLRSTTGIRSNVQPMA